MLPRAATIKAPIASRALHLCIAFCPYFHGGARVKLWRVCAIRKYVAGGGWMFGKPGIYAVLVECLRPKPVLPFFHAGAILFLLPIFFAPFRRRRSR
ncbi:hypothetical protein B0H14DRAFT_2879080 [Mycena olivaceomarginata]|nr:hypothetical protein B0H14DRAFT_2879080 [Mycena olivaceomarginata]